MADTNNYSSNYSSNFGLSAAAVDSLLGSGAYDFEGIQTVAALATAQTQEGAQS